MKYISNSSLVKQCLSQAMPMLQSCNRLYSLPLELKQSLLGSSKKSLWRTASAKITLFLKFWFKHWLFVRDRKRNNNYHINENVFQPYNLENKYNNEQLLKHFLILKIFWLLPTGHHQQIQYKRNKYKCKYKLLLPGTDIHIVIYFYC